MKLQPYYVIPLLLEQPTWGGSYIAKFKGIPDQEVTSKNIGQAYELASETVLCESMGDSPGFDLAPASDINQIQSFHTPNNKISLQDLIKQNPKEILGEGVVERFGHNMPLLIKFTQAQENSYQLHVKTGQTMGKWLPKPESWYYFEPGRATIGISDISKLDQYKQTCQRIFEKSLELSANIKSNKITVDEAREQLAEFVNKDHPSQYVNTIDVPKDALLDLSSGGIHHSWEKGENIPNGNILYEVQRDVKDDVSTLRSFDQAKIKDDGGVRPLTIDEYFEAIDTDQKSNNPDNYLKNPQTHQDEEATITKLFDNEAYHLTGISFNGTYSGLETETREGFHHLFVKEGQVTVEHNQSKYPLEKGWSIFIPAGLGHYTLHTTTQSMVLKTTV